MQKGNWLACIHGGIHPRKANQTPIKCNSIGRLTQRKRKSTHAERQSNAIKRKSFGFQSLCDNPLKASFGVMVAHFVVARQALRIGLPLESWRAQCGPQGVLVGQQPRFNRLNGKANCVNTPSIWSVPSGPIRPRSVGPSPRMRMRMLLDFLDQLLLAFVVDQLAQHQLFKAFANIGNVGDIVDFDIVLRITQEETDFGRIDIIEEQRGVRRQNDLTAFLPRHFF
jgi:hypothetical protein